MNDANDENIFAILFSTRRLAAAGEAEEIGWPFLSSSSSSFLSLLSLFSLFRTFFWNANKK